MPPVSQFFDPINASAGDIEFAIANFSQVSGMRWSPDADVVDFRVAAYAGSCDDGVIGYDLVPNGALCTIEAHLNS